MIDVRLLGQVALTVDDAPLSGEAAQRRRIALLALLCVPGPRPIRRDRLMLYLWPENGSESARHLLSVAIHALRGSLGHDALTAGRDDVALNAACFRIDVFEFEAALARGDHEQAVSLYGGPLMDGFHAGSLPDFDQWLEEERARLQRRYAEALECVAASRAAAGEHGRALEAWQRLAALDPYSSHAALGLMRALAAAGNRAAAIRHASVHAQLLDAELGAGPDAEVEALAEALRQEAPRPSAPPAAMPPAVPAPRPAVAPAPTAKRPAALEAAEPERSPAAGIPDIGRAPEAGPATIVETQRLSGTALPVAGPAAPAAPGAPGPPGSARRRRWAIVAAAVGVVGVIGGAVLILGSMWDRLERAPFGAGASATVSVAPLLDLTPAAGDTMLGALLAERVLDELQGSGLHVAPSFAVSERSPDARAGGPRPHVDYVVGGSFSLTPDTLHVSVELVDLRGGLRLWRTTYDRPRTNVGDLGKTIAGAVVRSLGARQGGSTPARGSAPGRDPPSARRL